MGDIFAFFPARAGILSVEGKDFLAPQGAQKELDCLRAEERLQGVDGIGRTLVRWKECPEGGESEPRPQTEAQSSEA